MEIPYALAPGTLTGAKAVLGQKALHRREGLDLGAVDPQRRAGKKHSSADLVHDLIGPMSGELRFQHPHLRCHIPEHPPLSSVCAAQDPSVYYWNTFPVYANSRDSSADTHFIDPHLLDLRSLTGEGGFSSTSSRDASG
jgi:hypothetical protein